MLPGGVSVLGVFIITDSDDKDTLATLRQVRVALKPHAKTIDSHVGDYQVIVGSKRVP